MVASSFSSQTRLYFLFNKSSFEFKPLLLKQEGQHKNFFASYDFPNFIMYITDISLDLCIIAFLKVLIMKGLLLKSTIFFFAGA